jgi:hypothetical protein
VTHPSDAPPGTGVTAGTRLDPGTDEHVLASSLGQPEVFGELYARHFAAVYRYVAGRLGPDAAMSSIDDLTAIRRLLDAPHPSYDVTASGQARLDELIQHEAGHQRAGRSNRGGRGPGRRHIGIFAAVITAAAVAAVAGTLTLVHPRAAPPAAAQSADKPPTGAASTAPGPIKQAILTAVGAVGGDITHVTVSTSGGPPETRGVVQYWWWPAKPAPGQQVRLLFTGNGTREAITFTEPASSPGNSPLQLIPASGSIIDPASKTWQTISRFAYEGVFVETTTHLLEASYLRSAYLTGGDVINEHAAVDGRSAIEINAPAIPTLRVLLWVDAQTYLPFRQVKVDSGATNNPETTDVYDYQFLPATPANLAALTLSVPSGYTKASS